MTPKQRKEMAGCLNLLNEGAGVSVTEARRKTSNPDLAGLGELPLTRNLCPPRKKRIPRKPSPAQIERFEALRARVMGIPESR
ncbi:hypothetical protein HK16_06600 [Acetobacter senegalensis]|uniref:Uncharacterized protein n=2 Tax=Acetobacter TaxID=434 RepID=A0A252EKQ4_9PROT|nr:MULTISPECIES: hypothetical protein [Acetobacter]ATJ90013.1 hypothetical protein CIW82_04205 [Acetobacter tropicalis]OUL66998.1 hypothetical protein HK16_06600 [Acetobacter senegalensis]